MVFGREIERDVEFEVVAGTSKTFSGAGALLPVSVVPAVVLASWIRPDTCVECVNAELLWTRGLDPYAESMAESSDLEIPAAARILAGLFGVFC